MKVNFNNLRKKACYSYDRLATKLNDALNSPPYEEGEMVVYTEDIQEEMDNLRELIMGIAMVYKEGDEDFKDVSDEVEPIAWFNKEEDE